MAATAKIKKIGVTGGKGGTGKTTFAVLLANKLINKGKKVLLVDLDVECPNLHLLLGKNIGREEKKIFAYFPVLDEKKCKKCGKCVEVCKENAIFQAPGKFPEFILDLCSACGACSTICPQRAIKKKKKETGKIYSQKINKNLYLISGEAKAGLEETSPVVLKTKKTAFSYAKNKNFDFAIFDTAAGTHCPVISALLNLDFAYTVTEPTPLGAHDLDIILNLLKRIKVPAKVVLNQANLGSKGEIEKISRRHKNAVKIMIPYSKKIVTAYSRGKLLGISF